MSELLSTIRRDIDAELADAAEVVEERQAALTQALGIQSGLEFIKEAMARFDAGVYPTDEDAAEPPLPMTDEELDAAIRSTREGNAVERLHWPVSDPPATREEILRQLREHPPGFTSLELQARLALSEAVVDGHLRALRKEGAVELRDSGRWAFGAYRGARGARQ